MRVSTPKRSLEGIKRYNDTSTVQFRHWAITQRPIDQDSRPACHRRQLFDIEQRTQAASLPLKLAEALGAGFVRGQCVLDLHATAHQIYQQRESSSSVNLPVSSDDRDSR